MKIFVLLFQGELETIGEEPVRPVLVLSDWAADELKHDNIVVCHLICILVNACNGPGNILCLFGLLAIQQMDSKPKPIIASV